MVTTPILLLDKATSALDAASERLVQNSLDRLIIAKKRITIVIAHRLSIVCNADKIAFIQDRSVAELGPHEDLIKITDRKYAQLVRALEQSTSYYLVHRKRHRTGILCIGRCQMTWGQAQ